MANACYMAAAGMHECMKSVDMRKKLLIADAAKCRCAINRLRDEDKTRAVRKVRVVTS
jgi:hypothetical protein